MTCGKECRLRRRRRQEVRRREADVAAARELDRARQQRHRDPHTVPDEVGSSRAGLSVQNAEAIEEIVEKLRQEQRLSRAGLRRQLRRLALEDPPSVETRN